MNEPLASLAIAAIAGGANAAVEQQALSDFITAIQSADDSVRGPAWQGAEQFGADAVEPLAQLMATVDMESARAANRALWKIVRHAGRPGAATERNAVATKLVSLLRKSRTDIRREMLWMLSEIGDDKAVPTIASLLSDKDLRDDARAALERIPGKKSLAALRSALSTASADFKQAIAVSLRVRGEKISKYPSQKLVPTKQTNVRPVSAA